MEKVAAYPLNWPAGWRRTPVGQRARAKFVGEKGRWVENQGYRAPRRRFPIRTRK